MSVHSLAVSAILIIAVTAVAQDENATTLGQIIDVLKAYPDAAKEDPSSGKTQYKVATVLHRLRELPGDSAHRDEVSKLLDPLLTSRNHSLSGESLYLMKKWGTEANVKSLIELLSYRDMLVRQRAMEALGNIGGKQAAEAVGNVLATGKETQHAMYSLMAMGEVAEPIAWKYVGAKYSDVHEAACRILGKVGGSKSLARMKALDKKQVKGGGGGDISDAIRAMEARLVKR
jgi:hypothetical protein